MDIAIDRDSFLRAILPGDLPVDTDFERGRLADDAFVVAKVGFDTLQLDQIPIKGKIAHRIASDSHRVVLRRVNHVLKHAAAIKPTDRDVIIRQLATVLREGVNHKLYKLDIKEFFESIDPTEVADAISVDKRIPRGATIILFNYLRELGKRSIRGMPRGVPLSATLAEYVMKDFDAQVSRLPEVYYYARFVDDIVIVTGAREDERDFQRRIRKLLPSPLVFNNAKSRFVNIPVQLRSDGSAIAGEFDYLGYHFAVHESKRVERKLQRNVRVSIAPKKIARIKTRLCCAVARYIQDSDIDKLTRRVQLLTGNYNIRDRLSGQVRNTGLYCNYRRTTDDTALVALDQFLHSLVVGSHGRLARRMKASANRAQRVSLLRFSFARSFRQRTFYNFSPSEILDLSECWRHAKI